MIRLDLASVSIVLVASFAWSQDPRRVAGPESVAPARNVAAPASDILAGLVRLPDPRASATSSRSQLTPLSFRFEPAGADRDGVWAAETTLDVDRSGALLLALIGGEALVARVHVRDERGAWTPIESAWRAARSVQTSDALPGAFVAGFEVPELAAGRREVRVTLAAPFERPPRETWLASRAQRSTLTLAAWVDAQELVADTELPILARLDDGGVATNFDHRTIERARVLVDGPRGALELALADDGAHGDGAARDGVFGVLLPAGFAGDLRARVELGGLTRSGEPFTRSVALSFPVLERRVLLDGGVDASVRDDGHVTLALNALPLGPRARLHTSAELWGSDASGALVPVCWLSRIDEPRDASSGAWSLELVLDRRWLEVVDARAPFELRELRVQDADTHVVFDRLARADVALPELPPRVGPAATAVVPEMLTGAPSTLLNPPPSALGPHRPITPIAIQPALMLVHGYCSSGSIWPAADFSAPKLEFLDPNANRTHDQFAQLIAQRANQAGLTSFGIVAHSQGGCAALHLLTYYTTGLDVAIGARRIQSLATPYQGTPLASLGSFACGVNNDMTPAGAATWLAGIPSWARNEVWYWTTSNTGSACNFLTNLFLSDPEDGTVEQTRGQLSGAHNQGHTTGWCHTTGMSNPASYTDHVRNQAMNAAAAR